MRHPRTADPPAVRIEAENEWAWCGERRLELMPRPFALLRYLVDHRERLVTKDELLTAVWRGTIVSEAALTSCIRDLRRALADSSRAPRYIETVHRRGFRFVGPIVTPSALTAEPPPGRLPDTAGSAPAAPRPALVGREAEVTRLHELFETAARGQRRLVFVTGEAGIGKTALIDEFLARLGDGQRLRIGRGQCVEQYGAGEAYLPVLEALGRIGREARGDELVRVLVRYAPTWLVQLPALLTDEDAEAVQRRAQGATRERMLRELIEAFDVLSADVPLVLVLEDLHWSDSGTVDLLAMLACRRDAARLLILATYRPADVAASGHPLKPVKQELELHGHCAELALAFLGEDAVSEYLAGRFPGAAFPSRFAQVLHENTSGNPLFLVNVIDHLIARGELLDSEGRWQLSTPLDQVISGVPHTLWQMVEKQIDRLTEDEQGMLVVASVAGAEFSAALSTVDGIDAHEGERRCEALARRGQFIRQLGVAEWPDGTVAGRYGFIHTLYRNVLYARVPVGHRVGLHLRIGARLEQGHGGRAGEIAGELAMHFEQGRDFARAIEYRRQAADGALRHHGYREAADHSTRALELLLALPESPGRIRQELTVHTMLGAALIAKGWTGPEVARTYARARELCTRVGATSQLFLVLNGLFGFYVARGELRVARELADQLLTMAEATDDSGIRLGAQHAAGMASFYAGDFVDALAHLERGMEIYDPLQHSPNRLPAFWGGLHDARVSCGVHAAWALWVLGHPDRGAARMQEALTWARSIDHPLSLAFACQFGATFHQCRRETEIVRELEEAGTRHATEHGFDLFVSLGAIYRGWLLSEEGRRDEAVVRIRHGLTAYRDSGAELGTPTFLGILAEVSDRAEAGLAVLADAVATVERTGLHYWDAELRRLKGALMLRANPRKAAAEKDAESCFLDAVEIARRQKAKSLELRAATSLGRLWQRRGRAADAHALLSEVYGWFTEGFETADCAEATALLGMLERDRKGR